MSLFIISNVNMNSSIRYEGIDSCRAFSSFGVVLLHVFVAAGHPPSLDWLIRLRDCALPLMVMTSFFLLTTSLLQKKDDSFQGFLSRRFKRLWLPLFVWTIIYCLLWMVVVPVLLGENVTIEFPPLSLFLTGYIHLWFLQFIFAGSLIVYPAAKWVKKKKNLSRTKLFYACGFFAALYGIVFHFFLKYYTDWERINPEANISLITFVTQVGANVLYISVAVGLALMSAEIKKLYSNPLFRRLSLAAVLGSMSIHLTATNIPFTREIYGVAVFLAVLQPWEKIPSNFVSVLATYSYGIYIIHFFLAQMLWRIIAIKHLELDATGVIIAGVFIYFLSFIAAVLIRKLTFLEWMLPLVPFNSAHRRQQFGTKQERYFPLKAA